MTDLTARAIIMAVDRFSGPVQAMGGALNGLIARSAAAAQRMRAMGSAMSSPLAPTAVGLGLLISRTQEFEKKALGARIATVADAMSRVDDEFGRSHLLIDHEKIARDGDAIRNAAMATSKLLGVSPTGLMEAAEAAAKMGIELAKAESIMRTSALLKMADPELGFGRAAEFMGTLGLQFKAPGDVAGYTDFIKTAGDQIATVASATRTTVSRIEEGFRQFSGTFATFGANIPESAALIGAMTQGGLLDVESGTALKSAATRFVRPTLEGLSALNALGIDRRNYMNLTGADPRRATNQLMQLFTGYLDKGDKRFLLDELGAAQKQGVGADPEFIDRIAGHINQKLGGKETLEDTYLKVLNTITTSGGDVKIVKFLEDIAKGVRDGRIDPGKLATIFEGRHLSRMMTLFNQWPEFERLRGIVGNVRGEGLEATLRERNASSYGRWEAADSAFERMEVVLRNSEAMKYFVEKIEQLSTAIASLDRSKIELIGQVAAGLIALGAVGLTASAIGAILGAITTLVGGIAALTGAPFLAAAAAITALALGIQQLYEHADKIKKFFGLGKSDADLDAARDELARRWEAQKMPGSGLPPLARTTDELIRSLEGWRGVHRDGDFLPGPRSSEPVQVQGEARIKVDVDIHGLPQGATAVPRTGGDAKVPLNTGRGMSDTR